MKKSELTSLIKRHRLLDKVIESHRDQFLSDWSCDNPFFERLLGPKLLNLAPGRLSSGGYIYFDEEHSIMRAIRDFHQNNEKLELSLTNVIAGPGSSSFLAVFSLWLRQCGYTDIYYLPPLYHTFHFLLDALDIKVIPVSKKHAFEASFAMKLPKPPREFPRLCRGGSRSLTFKEVPIVETSPREPPSAREERKPRWTSLKV